MPTLPPREPSDAAPWQRRLPLWVLLAVLGLTAWARLRSLADLYRDGHWVVASGDSWYHVRRILWQALGNGELVRDDWVHAPGGNLCVWPAGFDGAGALLCKALGPSLDSAVVAGFVLVLACAVATAGLAAIAARRYAKDPALATGVAGLVVALHPALHNYTQVGKIDHHAAEPLVTFLALAALIRTLAGAGWKWPVLAVVGLVAPLLLWPSSAMTVALLAGWTAVGVLATAGDQRPTAGRRAAAVFGAAGLLALPLGWTAPFGEGGRVAAEALSLLQPGLLLLSGASLLAMTAAHQPGWRGRLKAAALGGTLAVVGLWLWDPGRAALLGGGDFVAGKGYVALIAESASTLESGPVAALGKLGWTILAAPLLVGWAVRDRGTPRDPGLWMWSAALVAATAMAMTQQRFATLPVVPLAVLAGSACAQGWPKPRQAWIVSAAAILLAPGLYDVASRATPLARRAPVWQALDWLKARTPSPGDPWKPGTVPQFSVLAGWGFGHDLLAWGGQANVCSPLIAPGQTQGLQACARLILADDDIAGLVERHRIHWWIATPLPLVAMRAYGLALGDPADRYVVDLPGGERGPTAAGMCATAQVLMLANGSAPPDGSCKARPHWRLAHAAAGERAKVFERVAGAIVRGRGCAPRATARLQVRYQVGPAGYVWQDKALVGADGTWSIRVPWSSGYARDSVHVLDIQAGCEQLQAVQVPEAAVQAGTEVWVEK